MKGWNEEVNLQIAPLALQAEGYKQIKPETNITIKEAQSFWDNYFDQPLARKDD